MADGFDLLEHDHRTVEALFDEYEQNGDDAVADKICFELTVHGLIEEAELYPVLRSFGERTEEMVDQAETQHTLIKNYVGRVQALTGEERVRVMEELWAVVDGHVRDEETEIFPELRDAGVDAAELGRALEAAKAKAIAGSNEAAG